MKEEQVGRTAIPRGPVNDVVASNIRTIRKSHGWTQQELIDRLITLGRTLNPIALHRIEMGTRRVDVDDLAAFAKAFDLPPQLLLAPVRVEFAPQEAP